MVRIVWRSDAHLSSQAPCSRVDDWTETILGKLEQVGEVARKVRADAVVDGGDLFHIKSPSRNPHSLVHRVAQVHASYPCPVYLTPGNHDLKYASLDFLDESPLGVLFESGVFRRLYDEHEATIGQEVKVRLVGIPYHGPDYDFDRFQRVKKGDEDWLVVVAHCLASPSGGTLFDKEDVVSYTSLVDLDPDVWAFAHWHKDQGVSSISPTKSIVNLGSLSRGALIQDDLDRTPSCAVLTFDRNGVDIEEWPLQVRPAHEVFDVDRAQRTKERESSIEGFVSSLWDSLASQKGESLTDLVRRSDASPEVKEKTISYLEKA